MNLEYRQDISMDELLKAYDHGWRVIVSAGKILGFVSEGGKSDGRNSKHTGA